MAGFFNLQEKGRPVTIKDEGISLTRNVASIDMTGAGVTGTTIGDNVTEVIPGGVTSPGGSTTQIQYNNAGVFAGSANLIWNNTNATLQVGSNATVNSNVKFLMRSGAAGTMGYPYEVGVFERNGDTKVGIYNSSPTAGGPSGASLTFGYTNFLDNDGYFPGLEFQYDGSAVPTESKGFFTFLQRNYLQGGHNNGDVVAVPSRPFTLVSSGRAGVMCDPFDTFVVQGGIHSISYVNSFQDGEHLMDWGVSNNARNAAIGDTSTSYPNYTIELHSDSTDVLPYLKGITIIGDDVNLQALVGVNNTTPIKPFHVVGNGAESGMVVFDDTFSGNRMVFGNSGATSDADMNIWTNTGILNIGDGGVGAAIRVWNGGSGVSAQIAADGNHTYFNADGNGYTGINTASPSALFFVNDRGLGAVAPSLAVYDNDAGAYGICLFSSDLRQFNIGCATDNSSKQFSFSYADAQFDIYDLNVVGTNLQTRIAGGSTDVSYFHILGGSVGFGTDTPSQLVDINGNIRLRGQVYDETNSPGSSGDILINNGSGGAWSSPVSAGVTSVVDTVSLTNKSADIGSTNLTNSAVAGLYRISYVLEDTTADLAAGAVTLTIGYTDGAGSATTASSPQVLTGVGRTQGTIVIQLASGSITYATAHTGLFGTAKYALYITSERLK